MTGSVTGKLDYGSTLVHYQLSFALTGGEGELCCRKNGAEAYQAKDGL